MSAKIVRLELHNFKSYSGNVVVGPFNDFSCIVGPNGSGKSNLMDSLSFVLGASSKTLRSAKATDFINRSAKKAEASVTLVLKQSNGTEVALKRTVDGKGNVLVSVDNLKVTEKEFVAVLKKLKMGHRISNFLVFQHEVEAVAQKKAKELTELLEQISGSIELKDEYDMRKKALEKANESLAAASMEKRGAMYEVNQMRLHKKEAERFEEINSRMIAERRDLALAELFHIEVKLVKQKQSLEGYAAEIESHKGAVASEDEIKKTKKKYAEQHRGYLELLKKNREVTHELRDKKSTLDRINASIEYYTKRLNSEKTELKDVKDASSVRSKEVSRLEQQLKQQEALLAAFEKQCVSEDAEDEKKGKLTADQLKEYRGLRKDADCQTITLRQELETSRRQRDSLNEGLKQAANLIDSRKSLQANIIESIRRNEARIAEVTQKMQDLRQTTTELEGTVGHARAALQQLQERSEDKKKELTRINEQLHELRHLKEDSRHGNKMSETLKALRSMYAGIHGRLVDLCTIPNAKYRNAVTVALGKNLEAVVVDTVETALACVRYLKEQRIPAMTFIPLATASGKEVDDRLRTMGGSCKPVADVIKYDAAIEMAVRYALGQCLVCDSIDEGKRIAYGQQNQRFKVVITDGTVLLKNGSIQGGLASIQSRARKWDEKIYDDLKAARDKLMREGMGARDGDEARAQVEAQDAASRLEFSKNRLKQLDSEITNLKKKNQQLVAERTDAEKAVNALKLRHDEYADNVNKVDIAIEDLNKKVGVIESRVFNDFQKKVSVPNVAELERKQLQKDRERQEKRQQLSVLIHKLKTSIDNQTHKVGEKNLADVESQYKKLEKEMKTCETDLVQYRRIVENVTKKQQAIQESVTTAKAALEALEATIRKHGKDSEVELKKLAGLRKSATMLQASCEALRVQRHSLFQQCRMEEVELPTVAEGGKRQRDTEAKRSSRSDPEEALRLSEAFNTLSESEGGRGRAAAKEAVVSIDFTGLSEPLRFADEDGGAFDRYKAKTEAFIDQLERELETIAPNLKATARFSSSEQKLGNTANQLDDCREKARKALTEFTAVKELRTSRFMDTFEKIAEHVDVIYRELTMGTRAQDVHGSAYLSLEDADEPYNGGTKYHATPPMKRFMTIELLSGGERTMAALALLFAIHRTSPAPFFVLDEVDAALDAANVGKLAHYLRTHSDRCQFVVVSLKDQLYHTADSLIGVFKDLQRESSGTLTLDLRQYPAEQ